MKGKVVAGKTISIQRVKWWRPSAKVLGPDRAKNPVYMECRGGECRAVELPLGGSCACVEGFFVGSGWSRRDRRS